MARSAIPVEPTRLQEALEKAEKNGVKNLSDLWVKAAEIYNSISVHKITPSVAMLRSKDLRLIVMTKPGKRGRQTGAKTKRSGLFVLMPLAEFKTHTIGRGRSVGNETSTRPVLALDKYNWIIGVQNNEGSICPNDRWFCAGFKTMFSLMQQDGRLNPISLAPLIANKLQEVTGVLAKINFSQNIKEVGKQIDRKFNVNFCLNHDTYQLIAKQEAVENEADE
jgi:hypothetical protein